MKKIVLIALVIVFAAGACFAFPNEPDGFRGIKWGAELNTVHGLVKVVEHPLDTRIMIYKKTDERLEIANLTLSSITYQFLKKRFYSVELSFKSESDAKKFREACFINWGKAENLFKKAKEEQLKKYPQLKSLPQFRNLNPEWYNWNGDKAKIKLQITPTMGLLTITSVEMIREAEKPINNEEKELKQYRDRIKSKRGKLLD